MTIQFTTTLPDATLTLDASVEDELTTLPETTPALNHGEYRTEYRESGQGDPWTDLGTTPSDGGSQTVTGLEDGEKYDFRIRSQTTDVTGEWYVASAITLLPAPGQPSFPAVSQTSVDLSWADNADNETQQTIRRERTDEQGVVEVATVDPDVTSDTDDTVQPGREYAYVVRTATEHVVADSPSATVTTPSTGRPQAQSHRSAWTVEVDDPARQEYRHVEVAGTPQWRPRVNGRPEIDIPISAGETWLRDELLEQPVRVWYQGTRLPFDELRDVDVGPATYTLRCRAGRQLSEHVQAQFDERANHLAATDLLSKHTGYALDIDSPDTDTRSDVRLAEWGSAVDFEDLFDDQLTDPTSPLTLVNGGSGGLQTHQTGWLEEAEDAAGSGFVLSADSDSIGGTEGAWSGNRAARFSSTGDYREITITPDYDLSTNDLEFYILFAVDGGGQDDVAPDLEAYNSLSSSTSALPTGQITNTAGPFDLQWQSLSAGIPFDQKISAGESVTLGVEATSSGADLWMDCLAVVDGRYSYTFDASQSDGVIDGPEEHPAGLDVVTGDVQSVEQILAATLELSISATDGSQALALSSDQGQTWVEASNTDQLETTFSPSVSQLRARVTLSRSGDRSTISPGEGYESQALFGIDLQADLDDTPILYDKVLRGRLVDLLADDIADPGDLVFELKRDPDAAWDDPDGLQVAMTQAGQRERSRVPESLVDFSGTKTAEGRYDKIIVRGGSETVTQTYAAQDPGTSERLEEWPVVAGSETIEATDGSQTYERGTDYTLDYETGFVEILSGGGMVGGETYSAEYDYRFVGSAKTPGVSESEAVTREERIPTARSDIECQQLALGILRRVQEPLVEVEVTVATSDPTISLLEAINHPDLPLSGPLVPREQTVEPGEVTWTLGTRRGFAQIVQELQSGLRELADAV